MKKKLLKFSLILSATLIPCYFLAIQLINKESDSIIIEKNNIIAKPQLETVKIPDVKFENEKSANQVVKEPTQLVSIETKNKEKASSKFSEKELDSIEKLREKYHQFVNYHPLRKKMKLPKAERKAMVYLQMHLMNKNGFILQTLILADQLQN